MGIEPTPRSLIPPHRKQWGILIGFRELKLSITELHFRQTVFFLQIIDDLLLLAIKPIMSNYSSCERLI